jgi:hypothetical protein
MKVFAFFSLIFACINALALVNGHSADENIVRSTFGLNFDLIGSYKSIDTPEIPIGPRVAITCGHCASGNFIYPDLMKSGANDTNQRYENLKSGTYGLPFFERANYPYDLALVILREGSEYPGPYVTVSQKKVQLLEKLIVLGKGKNTSSQNSLCDGYDESHKYDYETFQVIDFYAQEVGFIATGLGLNKVKPAVTCFGDSGAYYFRALEDKTVELVGINSWGTEGGIEENPNGQINIKLQGYLSGAGDLTSIKIQNWLSVESQINHVDICGINSTCTKVKWPFPLILKND